MTHFQQAYTAYPSPAVVVNTPTPMSYQPYSQHPSMQPAYYPSVQPQIIQQPYYPQPGGGYLHNHSSTLSQLCMWLLCLGACTYCCTEGCCGPDDCCGGGGVYNDDCCGCC